jgi:hypothetical protein
MISTVGEIAEITGRGKAAFDADLALRLAVERCLAILGEAANAVSPALTTLILRSHGAIWRRCATV